MESTIGVNLRVTAHSNQGGRKYMEDLFTVAYQPSSDERDLLYAYFGIFDGHGGRDAASYAKAHLMDFIVSQKNFWSDDDEVVKKAISDGFIATHYAMWKELEKWPKTASGLPSTSGTTASIVFVRRGKMYIGHVGDSGIILGIQEPGSTFWRAKALTRDHKPENAAENDRILKSGGKVISKSGVPRVVWNRPRIGHKGPVRRSTHIDEIPFLAVARSLGDLWSYNSAQNEFVVSPMPDVSVVDIDVNTHRCIILGSDGLWNMLQPQDAVNSVYYAERNNERQLLSSPPDVTPGQVKNWINPSKRLVDRALDRWYSHNLRADNTSVVTVVIDPPGPPKAQVLRQSHVLRQQSASSVTDPSTSKTVPAMVLAPMHGPKPAPCASNYNLKPTATTTGGGVSTTATNFTNRSSNVVAEASEGSSSSRVHRSRSTPPSTPPESSCPTTPEQSVLSTPGSTMASSSSVEAKSSDISGNQQPRNSRNRKRKFQAVGKNSPVVNWTTPSSLESGHNNSVCSSIPTSATNVSSSKNVSRHDPSSRLDSNISSPQSESSASSSVVSKSQNHDDSSIQIHEISSSSESSNSSSSTTATTTATTFSTRITETPIKRRKMTRSATSTPENPQQLGRPQTRNSKSLSTRSDQQKKNVGKLNRKLSKSCHESRPKRHENRKASFSKKLPAASQEPDSNGFLVARRRQQPTTSSASLKTPEMNSNSRTPGRTAKTVPVTLKPGRSLRSDTRNAKRITRSNKK